MKKGAKIGIGVMLAFMLLCIVLPMNVAAENILNETTVVAGEDFEAYEVTSDGAVEWTITISSDEPIDLRMVTSENYEKFQNGEEYMTYTAASTNDVTAKTYTVTLPAGTYYVVLDNSGNLDDTDVSIKISAEDAVDSPGFELFAVVLAIGLCIGIVSWRRKK